MLETHLFEHNSLHEIVPHSLHEVVESLPTSVYLVGGIVRDSLLGHLDGTQDFDITSFLEPDDIIKIFEGKQGYKIIPTGIDHGTVTILCPNNDTYEHTTFRTDEVCYGRRASIKYVKSLEEDLRRRDFTVNAIAYELKSQTFFGTHQSFTDIKKNVLRFNGNPFRRITEDYLRIIRAVRFMSKYNMKLDWISEVAIRIEASKIRRYVSHERIRDEIEKSRLYIQSFLTNLYYLGVGKYIFPCSEDNFVETIANVNDTSIDHLWASLKPVNCDVESFQELFKLSNDTIRFIDELEDIFIGLLMEKDPAIAYRNINSLRKISLDGCFDFYSIDKTKYSHLYYIQSLQRKVVPDDILACGIRPGPLVKTIVDEAFRMQVRNASLTKEQILNKLFVREHHED